MKKFAGIDLGLIEIATIGDIRLTREIFRNSIQELIVVMDKDPQQQAMQDYLKYLQHSSVIKHVHNYLSLKDTLAQQLPLAVLVKEAVEHAPNDWFTQGYIRADLSLLEKYAALRVDDPYYYEILPNLECRLRNHCISVKNKNLQVAHDLFEEMQNWPGITRTRECIPYSLCARIMHYADFVVCLDQYVEEHLELIDFAMDVIYALNTAVRELKELPDIAPPAKNSYFSGRMFFSWPKEANFAAIQHKTLKFKW